MGDNSVGTPAPVLSTLGDERKYFDLLPKEIRVVLVEALYEYNTGMVYRTYNEMRAVHRLSRDEAIWETINQIRLNDFHTKQQETAKWKGAPKRSVVDKYFP